jgi:hypothetical protein
MSFINCGILGYNPMQSEIHPKDGGNTFLHNTVTTYK